MGIHIHKPDYTAKGDLLSASAAGTTVILAAGSNGKVLTTDSAETTGLKWATPATTLTITEVDGSPTGTPTTIKFTNGSVADNGDGSFTISTGAGAGGGDFSSNTAVSVDGEVVLFSGAGGKTGRRATETGIAKVASGVLSAVTAPSGAIVGTTDSQTLSNKTLDNTNVITVQDNNFTVQDNGDTTKQAQLQLSGLTTATTRTLTLQDASGTIAILTNRLDQFAAPNTDLSIGSNKLTNVTNPTAAQDAATKAYVDALSQGLNVKDSVRVATTANITLSGAQTIDGVSAIAGNRVLVKNQTTGADNGIYVVASGTWSRSTDADISSEVTAGLFTFVTEGTVAADTGWILTTNNPITLGTTSLNFTQFSSAVSILAGAGLTKTGSTIDAVGTSARILVNADSIDIDSAYVGQTSITTLGTIATGTWGATTIAVNRGGTGQTSYTNGQLLIGNTTGSTLTKTTLTGTANQVVVTNGTGSITLSTPQNIDTAATPTFDRITLTTQGIIPLLYGSVASDGDIRIEGTNHATKTSSYVQLQPAGGLVGIGLTTPLKLLHISKDGTWAAATDITDGQFLINATSNTMRLAMGVDSTTTFAYIQSSQPGVGYRHLQIQPAGGSVGIGTNGNAPGALLDLGLAGTVLGVVRLAGSTSGNVSIKPNVIAGTDIVATLQAVTGTIYVTGGTDVAVADGGTGASTAAGARTNLGLVIGTDVEAWDADLDVLATAFSRATASGPASLAFHEDTDNGTNKITVIGVASVASDKTLTLPDATDTLVGKATTDTLTNKRITKRTGTTTSSATPTINTDNVDFYSITAQAEAITSFTTNLSGTPTENQTLWLAITGTAARAITWGTSFESSTVTLPTTTVTTNRLDVGLVWNTVTSKWRCVATA